MPMDAKDIERHGRDLTKAVAQGESADVLLKFLTDLRSGVRASEDLLRSTKIGITVNKLKTHKDARVARQASDLVQQWKKDINKSGGASNDKSPKTAAAPNGGANADSKPSGANGATAGPMQVDSTGNAGDEIKVPPEKRNAKADGVDTRKTGNDTRDMSVKLLYDGLAFMSEQPIESHVFGDLGPETSANYRDKIRSLFTNLKNKSHPELRQRVATGDIPAQRFARMTNEELKSPERLAEERAIQKENMDKAMVAQQEESISPSLVCGKCGGRKVSYSQAQTRSADEPMTTFCRCTICENRWKFC